MANKSFFDRLTGNFNSEIKEEILEKEEVEEKHGNKPEKQEWLTEEEEEGQLAVDMYHTPTEVIIQTMVAGVNPSDVDISISQDMITIKGRRQKAREFANDNYYYKELYWGSFSRSILLPQDVDSEKIDAGIKNGVLTVHIPKINKDKIQKVKVKSE